MNRVTPPTGEAKTVQIRDVGGIRDAEFELRPGVNQLTGANGAGKSTAIAAITRAHGGKVPLEPRDGAREGLVTLDGVRLTVKGVVKAEGRAELALADESPIAQLIDPGLKDPDRAAEARIRALVTLVPMPLTPTVVATIAGNADVAREVQPLVDEGTVTDLLGLAERCRIIGNRLGLEAEKRASEAAGAANAYRAGLDAVREKLGLAVDEEPAPAPKPSEAQQEAENAIRRLEVARITGAQRAELTAQQAEVRATLGTKPDPTAFDQDLQLRQDALMAHERRVQELKDQIAAEQAAIECVKVDVRSLVERRKEAEADLVRWERRSEILAKPVEGPTPEDVQRLDQQATFANQIVERSRMTAQFYEQLGGRNTSDFVAKYAKTEAEVYRAAAQSVTERLGLVLQDTPAGGLTVNSGRLAVIEGDRVLDFETRQSFGQRVAHALRLAAARYAGKIVPISPVFWTALDDDHKAEFAAIAAEHGLYVITEQPADGELRMEHLEAEEVAVSA